MKQATKIVIALGTALTLGLGAAAVSGHSFDGPGYGMGPGMMGGNGQGWGGHMGGNGQGNADENLAALKTELGITAKQDAAWQAFAKNAKQQNEGRQAWFAKMREARDGAKSAPERLAQQAEFMKQRQLEMASNVAALKDLYAALTPEQKLIADRRFGGFRRAR